MEYPYKQNDKTLETSQHERDLGVWITNNLKWRKQVLEQCSKANKLMEFVQRSTRNISSQSARRTLVRAQVGYATQVWSPQSVELISQLERMQRRASKYILGLPFLCETSHESRLKKLNLPISIGTSTWT